ncbi:Na(+)-translocating NADH-quinone reductase subunit C [Larsenimonas rhizosphaerae]|uniref:Na(+)-translocating NADH-quinone reductase subunit C n=1 Tax=Larsenimonas rhizosphaerae TaxID=2944682 RepID=A0AA41ZE88_9GAMM|nr:Na(+)-translocating NADH-quinone reductase subunit C [Larsenimonas rhizosphaerae]MCM2130992.1 Na(+)-translocating NADH-quinone reductase subunit C [Larsenimonas rhizosphaerae]MCX2523697.1 Na(+)-translocating NADH-quinone reductase subunit C [Larsenimonas rhizosphaerae]
MASNNNSIKKTLIVAFSLCVVCSVVVSAAAVALRPIQQTNQELDRKTNILQVAELYKPGDSVAEQFSHITPRVVNLDTGKYSDKFDPETFDQFAAAADPATSRSLGGNDPAGIGRRENFATVYLVGDPARPDQIILPVRGQGLWSIMYGYLALKGDGNTIVGLSFYQQGETPGLGGEVDNPKWKALWDGKQVYADQSMTPVIRLVKGGVDAQTPNAENKVDALSGATLTSRGVTQLLQFWLGDQGFANYLSRFRDPSQGA